MQPGLINYIVQYGYISIFLLVFLQEIGIPTFSNELILIYFGYLSYLGILKLFYVLILAVSADVSGTFTLYILFYFFSASIKKLRPKWFPVKSNTIRSLKIKIGNSPCKIFIGRLIPYMRGYISIAAGLLHINIKRYGAITFASACIWSGGFVLMGWIIAPYWNLFSKRINAMSNILIALPAAFMLFILINFLLKKYLFKKNKTLI
jgi:membrane protein DedA with SNARE-associated domain